MSLPCSHHRRCVTPRFAGLAIAFWLFSFAYSFGDVPQSRGDDDNDALPLPRWSDEELRAFRENLPFLGSSGRPDGGMETSVSDITTLLSTPIPSAPRVGQSFDGTDSELLSRLRPEDMRLFLPESILGVSQLSEKTSAAQLPTPLSSLREVPLEFLAACDQAPEHEHLLDPEMLMPEMQAENMRRFLDFHGRDARIKLHILIMAKNAKLREGTDLGEVASGSLRQNDACLLVYPLGEPWRARLFVSKPVHTLTSASFLSETVQACVHEAMEVTDPHDQLHRYAVHLSTRLFWLQKALAADLDTVVRHEKSLAEVQAKPSLEAAASPPPSSMTAWVATCLIGGALLAFAGHRAHRRLTRKHSNRVWILPEPDTVPRLGGAFTGGGGGMIRYG